MTSWSKLTRTGSKCFCALKKKEKTGSRKLKTPKLRISTFIARVSRSGLWSLRTEPAKKEFSFWLWNFKMRSWVSIECVSRPLRTSSNWTRKTTTVLGLTKKLKLPRWSASRRVLRSSLFSWFRETTTCSTFTLNLSEFSQLKTRSRNSTSTWSTYTSNLRHSKQNLPRSTRNWALRTLCDNFSREVEGLIDSIWVTSTTLLWILIAWLMNLLAGKWSTLRKLKATSTSLSLSFLFRILFMFSMELIFLNILCRAICGCRIRNLKIES